MDLFDECGSISHSWLPSTLLHYDASAKASLTFNSTPTFPGMDFRCGSLLSFCVYGLLETPRLPATPRQHGNRRSVLAWSGWFRHLTYATSCRTSGLQTAEPSPATSLLNPQSLHIHDGGPGATAGTCIRRILIDTYLGAWLYSRHWSSTSRCCRRMGRNFCTLPKGSPKFSTFNGAL